MSTPLLEKQPKTLYFSSSKGIGFTYHFSEFACRIGGDKNFLFLSGELEQFPGVFSKLNLADVNRAVIPSLDTSKNVIKHLSLLRDLVKKFNPEIVHTQTNYQLLLASLLKPFYKFKIIQTIHAFGNSNGGVKMHTTKFYITIMCMIFAKKVVFQSFFVQNNFKFLLHKSCNLAMGFETPIKTKLEAPTAPFQVIYAAKFHDAKNHKWLIESLEPLLTKNLIRLILPGNGELFEEVEQIISDKKLSTQIKLPGWINRDEMAEYYNKSHLAIVPSKSETLGHNIIEPLAYGIPVISFPVGIAPDIAKESSAVQVIDFYATDVMLKLVEQFLQNVAVHEEISKEALRYFNKNLTWDTHIAKYKKIINEL